MGIGIGDPAMGGPAGVTYSVDAGKTVFANLLLQLDCPAGLLGDLETPVLEYRYASGVIAPILQTL
jgi:hypothetical protein